MKLKKRNEIIKFLKEKISKGLLKDKYLKNAIDLGLKIDELEVKDEIKTLYGRW